MKTNNTKDFLDNNQFATRVDEKGRECTACQSYKEWSEFKGHRRSKTGRSSKCKQCYRDERKSKGRTRERITRKQTIATLKKTNPILHKARTLRSRLMAQARKDGLSRSNLPTAEEIDFWFTEQQPFTCYYSGVPVPMNDIHVDHKQPHSRGGGHSLDNLCVTHKNMNSAKGKMTEKEFKDLLSLISGWEDGGTYLLARLRMGWGIG